MARARIDYMKLLNARINGNIPKSVCFIDFKTVLNRINREFLQYSLLLVMISCSMPLHLFIKHLLLMVHVYLADDQSNYLN